MILYCEVLAWINRGNTSTTSSPSKSSRFHTSDSMASCEPSGERIALVCIAFPFMVSEVLRKTHWNPKGLNFLEGCICHGIIDGHIYIYDQLHGIIDGFNICHGIVDVYAFCMILMDVYSSQILKLWIFIIFSIANLGSNFRIFLMMRFLDTFFPYLFGSSKIND